MTNRPKPITDAVKVVGTVVSTALGVVQTLVTLNLISSAQAEQVAQLGAAVTQVTPILADSTSVIVSSVGGLITIATGVLASFGVAKTAEAKVTPVEAPVDNYGRDLVPAGRE